MADENDKERKRVLSRSHPSDDTISYDGADSLSNLASTGNPERAHQGLLSSRRLSTLRIDFDRFGQQGKPQIVVDQLAPYYEMASLTQNDPQSPRINEHDLADTEEDSPHLHGSNIPPKERTGARSGRLHMSVNTRRSDSDDTDSPHTMASASAMNFRRNNTTTHLRRKSTKKSAAVEEFDWGDMGDGQSTDDDEHKKSHVRICGSIYRMMDRFPYWVQCLLSTILGDALIFVILGLPDILFGNMKRHAVDGKKELLPFLKWTSNLSVGDMPLLVLSVYLIMSWTLHFVTLFLLSIIPYLLERAIGLALGTYYAEHLSEYLNYFRKLRRNITIALWVILSNIIWNVFIVALQWQWKYDWMYGPNAKGKSRQEWWKVVQNIFLSLFAISAMWTAHKLLLEVIGTRFHRRAYKDRIIQSKFANSVLERLIYAIESSPHSQYSTAISSNGHLHMVKKTSPSANSASRRSFRSKDSISLDSVITDTSNKDKNGKKKMYKIANKFGKALNTVASEITNVIFDSNTMASVSTVPSTMQQSNALARALYDSLVQNNRDELQLSDFLPYFKTEKEAHRAFQLFDTNGNGRVSKSELKGILSELTNEKLSIEASIIDVTNAVSSLGYIIGSIVIFLMVLVIANIWDISTPSYVSTVAAIILPASFMFGTTAKEIFESIIFLFIVHPFDVGDRVAVDKEVFLVRSMSIHTTILERGDGRIVYAPNAILKTKMIDNTRRSGRQSEGIVIKVDIKTTEEQLQKLRTMMLEFLQTESKDLVPSFGITINQILIAEKAMILGMGISYKSNWQDAGMQGSKRNRFMFALRSAILTLGIQCPSSAAPETSDRL